MSPAACLPPSLLSSATGQAACKSAPGRAKLVASQATRQSARSRKVRPPARTGTYKEYRARYNLVEHPSADVSELTRCPDYSGARASQADCRFRPLIDSARYPPRCGDFESDYSLVTEHGLKPTETTDTSTLHPTYTRADSSHRSRQSRSRLRSSPLLLVKLVRQVLRKSAHRQSR